MHVRKRGLTTRDVVKALVASGIAEARIGVAGLKDKYAVTEQWLSVPWRSSEEAITALESLDGVTVLETSRHTNKLGTGHLHGNRFELQVRDATDAQVEAAEARFTRLADHGVPNYFGPQRFGRFGGNVEDGLKLLEGENVSGDHRLKRFFLSAVQSWIFNRVLALRIEQDLFWALTNGDWARKHETGGTFKVDDPAGETARVAVNEISALIPLHGKKVRVSEGHAGELEMQAFEELGVRWVQLASRRGDRRLTRVLLSDPSFETNQDGYRLSFHLPKGSYATAVLREVTSLPVDEPDAQGDRTIDLA
jgi:tRNA pseudouridine13 synthase